MSKNVNYLKKILANAIKESIATPANTKFYAAMMTLAAYGAKNKSSKEITANSIVALLDMMIWEADRFEAVVFNDNLPPHTYFILAIMQITGLVVDPDITITEESMRLARLSLTATQQQFLNDELFRQAQSPSTKVQEYFLGNIISRHIKQFALTPGNSGFASACFVVAKELNIPNIPESIWVKMINATNFSSGLLEKGTSRSRRSTELARVRRERAQQPQNNPPAYETLNIEYEILPPAYGTDIPPNEQPPEYDEIDLLGTVYLPPPYTI